MSNEPLALVSVDQVRAIMPNAPLKRINDSLPYMNAAMAEFKINTPERKAAFLAQIAHESVELKYFEEIASGRNYEGRRDLGNTQPGDGVRYKGRGPIQLTGRGNYRAVGQALGIDLENHPDRADDLDVCWRVAGHFWVSRKLNDLADNYAFEKITQRVNGGMNGYTSRCVFYNRALKAFGLEVQK